MPMRDGEAVTTTLPGDVYKRLQALADRELGVPLAAIVRRAILAGLPVLEAELTRPTRGSRPV